MRDRGKGKPDKNLEFRSLLTTTHGGNTITK